MAGHRPHVVQQGNSWKHIVPRVADGIRMTEYCGPVFPLLGSRSATKKAIKAGRLFRNGEIAFGSDYVREGDVIELRGSNVREVKQYNMAVDIVYDDPHMVVVNKPGGIAVNGNRYKTIENALADHIVNHPASDALPRPIAVHRIDVPTNGLVMLAKTRSAQMALSKAFQTNNISKEYIAVVHGTPPKSGEVTLRVDDKNACTRFETLRSAPSRVFGALSIVQLKPITGRTHQIRIHMKHLGHLIVGDKMYAEEQKTVLGKGVFLCARRLVFTHPITGESVDIQIDPPNKFAKLLDREESRFA